MSPGRCSLNGSETPLQPGNLEGSPPHERCQGARRQALELLQRPPRRRSVLRRLRRATHLPVVPQDGRGAAAAWPRPHRARGPGLALPGGPRRAGTRSALHPDSQRIGHHSGPPRGDLPQGSEPHPGPGQAQAAHRRSHRQRDLDDSRRRSQGRRVRGPARAQRRRHQVRGRPVLHAPPADLGDGRVHRPPARRDHLRPGVWDGWVLPRRLPAHPRPPPPPRPRPAPSPPLRGLHGVGDRGQHRPARCHEHGPARHRVPGVGQPHPGRRCSTSRPG